MSKEEIQKGNEVIASFMGWKEMSHTKNKDWMLSEVIDGDMCAKMQRSISRMEFHTSWDWLMPVVQKIIQALKDNYASRSISYLSPLMLPTAIAKLLLNEGHTLDIEHTFKEVVAYIEQTQK